MNSESLLHDVAWVTAQHIVEIFSGLLREDEKRDAFAEIYLRVKAGVECFEIKSCRMAQRMNPSKN